MTHVLSDLRPCWQPPAASLFFACVLLLWHPPGVPLALYIFGILAGLAVVGLTVSSWDTRLWRLACHVRRFRSIASDRVIVRFSPRIDESSALALLRKAEDNLAEFTTRFDFSIIGREALFWTGYVKRRMRRRGKLLVYLIHTASDFENVFARRTAGVARPDANMSRSCLRMHSWTPSFATSWLISLGGT